MTDIVSTRTVYLNSEDNISNDSRDMYISFPTQLFNYQPI